jgi:hypothetical protein
MEISIEADLTRKIEDLIETAPVAPPAVDQKQIDKQRKLAAERARDMARQNPNLSVAALARAAGCGTTAAKTALKMARESELVVTEV